MSIFIDNEERWKSGIKGITERYIYPGTRRLLANYTWYNGWQTGTKIFNYSGKSIPKFVMKNGAFYIIEYLYKGWEGKTIELWSNAANISSDTDEMTLSITNIMFIVRDDDLVEMGWMIQLFGINVLRLYYLIAVMKILQPQQNKMLLIHHHHHQESKTNRNRM